MSENHEPRALADLARALTDLGWTFNSEKGNERFIYMTHRELAGHLSFYNPNGPLEVAATDTINPLFDRTIAAFRAWQAPPSPDAGAAFAQAVDRYGDAERRFGLAAAVGGAVHDDLDACFAAKAALLAFAPSSDAATITESDSLEKAIAECEANGWHWGLQHLLRLGVDGPFVTYRVVLLNGRQKTEVADPELTTPLAAFRAAMEAAARQTNGGAHE